MNENKRLRIWGGGREYVNIRISVPSASGLGEIVEFRFTFLCPTLLSARVGTSSKFVPYFDSFLTK